MNLNKNLKHGLILGSTALALSMGLIGCSGGDSDNGNYGIGGDADDQYATTLKYNVAVVENGSATINLTSGGITIPPVGGGGEPDNGVGDGTDDGTDGGDGGDEGGGDTGDGTDILFWHIVQYPTNGQATITNKGELTYTPKRNWMGTDSIVVNKGTEADVGYLIAKVAYTIGKSVSDPEAPTISGTPPTQIGTGEYYSFTPIASDKNNDPLTFSISSPPDWATFDTATGKLSGTAPSREGVSSAVVISVSDGTHSSSLPAFDISVANGNTPPTVSGAPIGQINAGAHYSSKLTGYDADGDSLIWSQNVSWLSIDQNGLLTGTAPDHNITEKAEVVVSDGQANASLKWEIIVNKR